MEYNCGVEEVRERRLIKVTGYGLKRLSPITGCLQTLQNFLPPIIEENLRAA